jgi:cytochrome P450
VRAVINETLRLFPPVPINVRASRRTACTLPPPDPSFGSTSTEPLYMPGNTTIMYLPLLTQRNPALWGPGADEFDPSRWLRPDGPGPAPSEPASMAFAPFSIGPRTVRTLHTLSSYPNLPHTPLTLDRNPQQCLGQNYAYAKASYFLVRLLQRFDSFALATDVQAPGSLPPPEWKSRKGRQRIERVWPASSLTLFVKVRVFPSIAIADQVDASGRAVGPIRQSHRHMHVIPFRGS